MRGDPIALQKCQQELSNLRSHLSEKDLNMVSEILKLTQEKGVLAQENRELMREKLAVKRRLAEVEELLHEKGTKLELS